MAKISGNTYLKVKGCTSCPYAGHIEIKECPDAYTDIAKKCNLYDRTPIAISKPRLCMTKREAIRILQKDGWNKVGAEAIIDTIDSEEFKRMTADELRVLSEDYKDR